MSSTRFLHGIELIEIDEGGRSITTPSSAVIGVVGTAPDASPAAYATLALGADESGILLTANTVGLVGNSVRAEVVAADTANAELSVEVDETTPGTSLIRVTLGSDSSGDRSSTAAEVVDAINATTDASGNPIATPASGLVTASLLGETGDGIMAYSLGVKPLTGGLDEPFPLNRAIMINARRQMRHLGASGTLPKALDGIYDQADPVIYVVRVAEGSTNADTITNVIGGVDPATGDLVGVRALEGARVTPRVLIAPGFTQDKTVADELVSVARRLRSIVVIDGPNTTDEAAIEYRSRFGSERAFICDPWFVVRQPDGSEEIEAPSARTAGLITHIDATKGFWWSPSNHEILGVLRTTRAISWAINDPSTQANYLNEQGVATFINYRGVRLWGNRTAASDPRWKFLCVRRTADMINEALVHSSVWAVDRAITRSYFEEVTEMVNAYLRHLKARAGIIGGRCWVDPDLNTPEAIAEGQVYFDFDFTPTFPAEHIIFRSRMVNDYLEELF